MTIVNPLILSLTLLGPFQEDQKISDQFRCTLSPGAIEVLQAAKETAANARLILDLRPDHQGYGGGSGEAEMIRSSTPIASWVLTSDSVKLDLEQGSLIAANPQRSYPENWNELSGDFRIHPTLLVAAENENTRVLVEGPEVPVSLRSGNSDLIELQLNEVIHSVDYPIEQSTMSGILDIMFESQLLSEHYDGSASNQNEHMHRARVVLPLGYHDLKYERRTWPVIYLIPGRTGVHDAALSIAKLAAEPAMKKILPQAIWVVLEKNTPHGHHFFLDSTMHGPRSRALVEEFIPWLDVRFRTIPEPGARILVGEEQGGLSALTLLVEHDEVFADAWAISPEAVALDALGTINLYEDDNAFEDADGLPNPSLRSSLGSERELIHLDVGSEVMRSRVLDRNGDRWHELCATFGGSPTTNSDAWWPFDPDTGKIRSIQVSKWMENDLARRARIDPALAMRLNKHARILIGDRDEYYRNLGTSALDEAVRSSLPIGNGETEPAQWVSEIEASSSIEAGMIATMRRNEEIIEVLTNRGHHE